MPHFGEPRVPLFVPYNAKIADITHADMLKHFLDLETALTETRKIISILLGSTRIAGAGQINGYPNEGALGVQIYAYNTVAAWFVIADGTQRLQYDLSVANDDFDIFCFGYVVEI